MPDKINLVVEAEALEKFCRSLIARSRDIATVHDALVTLESFIVLFGRNAHGTTEYQVIESRIKSITDETRTKLLQLRTQELKQALEQCSVEAVTAIHTPLSRDGFYTILQSAVAQMTGNSVATITRWASQWFSDAKQRAETASGYPDALDFKKSGIRIEEYQAMLDTSRYLENRDTL